VHVHAYYINESCQREAPAAALLRPSFPAPAPPAPLSLLAEVAVAVEEVAVGNSEEEPELDRLLQEQLARIRSAWNQEIHQISLLA